MRLLVALWALAGLGLAGCAAHRGALPVESPYRDPATLEKGEIVHLATGRSLTVEELLDYLAAYPVVYVGETHDNMEDHRVELTVLQGLAERYPREVALGLEMLRRPFQEAVDAFLRGEVDEAAFVRDTWSKSWGPSSWPYYRDILLYCREAGIPVIALNAGRDLKDAVRDKGLDGLDPDMAARLPEMDLSDPYERAFLRGILGGHAQGSSRLDVFLRVQVLWEETMADTAARYLKSPEGQGRRLVVFAGGNHVRYGFGVPRRLFRRVPVPYAILEPYTVEVPEDKLDRLMDVDIPELPMRPADVYWAVGYEDLEGERVMLGIRIEEAPGGGARVLGVIPGSPADRAGIREGDVIVAVDGEPVRELFDLTFRVGQHRPGDTGPVEVLRDGERVTLEVTYDVLRHGR